jgi:hypothetical protein
MSAAEHLAAARGLFNVLAAFVPRDDDDAADVIGAFYRMADEVALGLEAVDDDTPGAVHSALEALHKAVVQMAYAGVAAGVLAHAADRKRPSS